MNDQNNREEGESMLHNMMQSPKNNNDIMDFESFTGSTDAVIGEEFEIRTSSFLFRQEIICRTVGGLPIY
jgi:hypothetical protein